VQVGKRLAQVHLEPGGAACKLRQNDTYVHQV
jgi:hypothetical protein